MKYLPNNKILRTLICIPAMVFLIQNDSLAQETITDSIMHDGIYRSYILYVPPVYDGTDLVPLVFNFHGYTSNARDQMAYGDFRPIADTANFLVVHPQGTRDNIGNTHFAVGWGTDQAMDVSFTNALIDTIAAEYSLDLDRIYSTGMSNGGFMSYRLACELGDRIAAIASVTGSMSPATFAQCSPTHATPILEIHGTLDFVVSYNGSGIARSIPDVIEYWVEFNNCNPTFSELSLPDLTSGDGSTVVHHIYDQCDQNINVELMRIDGGGHTWPGTMANFIGINRDINASDEIWKFFSRYDINGLMVKTPLFDLAKLPLRIYPNPASDQITIDMPGEIERRFRILDIAGKVVDSDVRTNGTINIANLNEGIYFLEGEKWIRKFVKVP